MKGNLVDRSKSPMIAIGNIDERVGAGNLIQEPLITSTKVLAMSVTNG